MEQHTDSCASPALALDRVILASESRTRARLLHEAGVSFETAAPRVDEQEVRLSLRSEGAVPETVARVLADLKAGNISRRRPGRLVIGADQTLECNGQAFDKPLDMDDARRQLGMLRGREHLLITCAAVHRDGNSLWHHIARAKLTMRPFGDDVLDDYLDAVGDAALSGPGAYQLEGLGMQLFSRIDGDYFSILGLPLLAVLDYLRLQRALKT